MAKATLADVAGDVHSLSQAFVAVELVRVALCVVEILPPHLLREIDHVSAGRAQARRCVVTERMEAVPGTEASSSLCLVPAALCSADG